jgi:hypothetical protein
MTGKQKSQPCKCPDSYNGRALRDDAINGTPWPENTRRDDRSNTAALRISGKFALNQSSLKHSKLEGDSGSTRRILQNPIPELSYHPHQAHFEEARVESHRQMASFRETDRKHANFWDVCGRQAWLSSEVQSSISCVRMLAASCPSDSSHNFGKRSEPSWRSSI